MYFFYALLAGLALCATSFALPASAANGLGHAASASSNRDSDTDEDTDVAPEASDTGKDGTTTTLFPPVTRLGNPTENTGPAPEHLGRDRDSGNENRPLLP